MLVIEDGFEYQAQRYRSLTEIARQITGAHWSGPRFFGLLSARKTIVAAPDQQTRPQRAAADTHDPA